MTLTTRLSLFFLSALAVVLVGFSASLYWLARSRLFHQVDERSTAVLDTLQAAADVEPDGRLEWDPNERVLAFGNGSSGEPIVWAVFGDERELLHCGPKPVAPVESPFTERVEFQTAGEQIKEDVTWQGNPWRLTQRLLRTENPRERSASDVSQQNGHQDKKQHRELVLAVGLPLDPVFGTLRALGFVLAGLSFATWISAALVGRWLCRRALAPVTRMARSARAITAEDLSQRLPSVKTGDELEDLGRAFNDLLTRIQDSFERQQRFTGEASHQLRTPLTAMLGQLEVALRRERSPEEYRRVLVSLQKQGIQLRQIVEMLLFLARADAEAKLPELERLDLCDWLTGHLQSWERHPRRNDIRLEIGDAVPLCVQAHPSLLGQAVDNLLDNACKYSVPGTPVVLRPWRQGKEVCLAVEDQGCGIAAEELPQVFAPFFRSPDARRRGIGGIGLGLAITQRIVVACGGRIEVNSQVGQGSRFIITLASALSTLDCGVTP
jgi:heavy metal sensor kinase